MPFRIHIDPSVNCAFIAHDGIYQPREGLEALMALLDQFGYRPGLNILRDARKAIFTSEVQTYFTTLDEHHPVIKYHRLFDDHHGACRLASVSDYIGEQSLIQGFEVAMRRSNIRRRQFHDFVEAAAWLGVPEDHPYILEHRQALDARATA